MEYRHCSPTDMPGLLASPSVLVLQTIQVLCKRYITGYQVYITSICSGWTDFPLKVATRLWERKYIFDTYVDCHVKLHTLNHHTSQMFTVSLDSATKLSCTYIAITSPCGDVYIALLTVMSTSVLLSHPCYCSHSHLFVFSIPAQSASIIF